MMDKNGLTKLQEECAELITIAAKKAAYFHTDAHPDGKGSMKKRLEEETGDVFAAACFVIDKFGLDFWAIRSRQQAKYALFQQWDADPDNYSDEE